MVSAAPNVRRAAAAAVNPSDPVLFSTDIDKTSYSIVRTKSQPFGIVRLKKNKQKPYSYEEHEEQYEDLTNFVMNFIQQQMVKSYQLKEVWMPENRHVEEQYHDLPKCNIFMSQEFLEPNWEANRQKRRACVLIQGMGAVRAGVWARSVNVYENFELGSMLPVIQRCQQLDIPVLVMNPNYDRDPETNKNVPFSDNMNEHALFVWEKYVLNSGFDQIDVIAHSCGGYCVQEI